MGLIKKCPSCCENLRKLPLLFAVKLECHSCGAWVKESPKDTVWGSILLVVSGFLAASIDWKLLVIVMAFYFVIGFLKMQYVVVGEQEK